MLEKKHCAIGGHELVPGAVYYTIKIQATTRGRGDNLTYMSRAVCRGHVLAVLGALDASPERCPECKTETYFCTCEKGPDSEVRTHKETGRAMGSLDRS